MNELRTTCPNCGKPVVFHGDFSMSSICEACGTIVVRPDYGQPATGPSGTIAAPIESDSPVELGMKGYYQGHHFEIRGVVRLGHDAGGFWDEWYLLFDDGRWGWLAEVQQHFYLTFAVEVRQPGKIPAFDAIQLEQRFQLTAGDPPMLVAEKGHGSPLGARGEIPYSLAPQKIYQYADLSGPGGRFGTIDFGETPPTVYFGRAVALGDLHLPHKPEDLTHEPRHAEAVHAACPNCHHGLTLHIPHQTVRVGCTNCGSLLDADEGRLQVARAMTSAAKPHLTIGAKGTLNGVQYTVVGYLQRCLKSDSSTTWDEYLLYDSQVGYRWLTLSDDHWHFVQAVPPGGVDLQGKSVRYEGKTYWWHEQSTALASRVLGEFYWKVDPGEQVWVTDYLCAPEMLSREITHGGPDSGEVSWSRAIYVPVQTIEQAFGLKHSLPRPVFATPTQPFSFGRLYAWWAVMVVLTLVLSIFFQFHHRSQKVFSKTYLLPGVAHGNTGGGDFGTPDTGSADRTSMAPERNLGNVSGGTSTNGGSVSGGTSAGGGNSSNEEYPIFFSDPFQVRDHENTEIRVRALGTNFWLGVDGDLVDEKSGVVQEFSLPVEYYEGVSEGERWTEGSREASVYLSALPAGQYTLRVAGQHEPPMAPLSFEVSVYEDIARPGHLLFALAGVSLIPGLALLVQCITVYSRRRGQ